MKMAVQGIRAGAFAIVALAAINGLARADDVALEPIQVGTPQRIEVFPPAVTLAGVREQMQIVVTGFYADGSVQDLTRAAEFASSNAEIFTLEGSVVHPKADGSADLNVTVGGQAA